MFQNRRRIFLFVCLIVLIQALYYIITLQIKNNSNGPVSIVTNSNPTVALNLSSQPTNSPQTDVTQTAQLLNTTTSTTTTTTPVPFINALYVSDVNPTGLLIGRDQNLPACNFTVSNNDTSIYKIVINQTLHSYSVIEKDHAVDLYPGGHYLPKQCQPSQKLAVIICYRNREQHLRLFLANIHPFLKKQQLDYTIFVVNQHGTEQFNRAALFNVGYLEAVKLYPYDCFIFHDVDLLPEDLRNVYRCGDKPRHMSVAVDKFNYKLLYSTLFGGVTAFRLDDFIGANGYPTVYWGWGGEDDDMYLRVVKKLNKSITRYPIEIARYKMIRTHDHTSGKANPHRHTILYSKYDYSLDGINTTNYSLHQIRFFQLFTFINATLPEEPFDKIRQRLHIKKKK